MRKSMEQKKVLNYLGNLFNKLNSTSTFDKNKVIVCRLGETQQYILSANMWGKCANNRTYLLPKPDFSDILNQPTSDRPNPYKQPIL